MVKKVSTSRSFITLSGITIVEKIIGFLYQAVIAAAIGANIITDCYFSTFELLTLIDYSIIAAMAVALLRQYTSILINDGKAKGEYFLSNVRSIIFPLMILLSIILFSLSRPITFLIAPTYDDTSRDMLATNIRWMSFVPVIFSYVTFYLVVLRQQGKFAIVGLKSFFINAIGFVAIGVFLIIKPDDSVVLCLGYNAAMLIYTAVGFIATRKNIKIRWCKPQYNDEVKTFIKMWLPLIISNGIVRISLMVDRVISTSVGEGGVTCLSYSQMLFYFIEGLFVTNISTILLSDFTNLVAKKDHKKINSKIKNAISTMIIILMPITIISIIYSNDIVKIVFGHGKFGSQDVKRVAGLLLFYAIGFVPSVISNIYMQVMYSFARAKNAMYISVFSIIINIISSLVFVYKIGLSGVAIGTSISYVVSGFLYYYYAKKDLVDYKSALRSKTTIHVLIGSIVCFATVYLIHSTIKINGILSFIIATGLSGLLYLIILLVLGNEIIKKYYNIIKKHIFNTKG